MCTTEQLLVIKTHKELLHSGFAGIKGGELVDTREVLGISTLSFETVKQFLHELTNEENKLK